MADVEAGMQRIQSVVSNKLTTSITDELTRKGYMGEGLQLVQFTDDVIGGVCWEVCWNKVNVGTIHIVSEPSPDFTYRVGVQFSWKEGGV